MLQVPRWRFAAVEKPTLKSTGHAGGRSGLRLVALVGSLAIVGACSSSFFQLSPTPNGDTGKPGASAPAKAPAKAPEKPAEKAPKPEKPKAEPKKTEPKVEPKAPPKVEPKVELKTPPKAAPETKTAAVAPPPVMKRPEPIVEPPVVEPTPAGSDSAGVARLMHAAALWDAVRLFHPAVATQGAAWDNATVRRLTDVRTANTRGQYVTVMTEWLSRLNDPATYVRQTNGSTDVATGFSGSSEVTTQTQIVVTGAKKTRSEDTTVVLTWPAALRSADTLAWNSLRLAILNASSASQLVIDLRAAGTTVMRGPPVSAPQQAVLRAKQLAVAKVLTSLTLNGPAIRRRVYEGWPDERSNIASAFGAAVWRLSDPMVVVRGEAAAKPRRIVFVADKTTDMAPALLALVSGKQAILVSEGALSDNLLVPTTRIPLGDGLEAVVRTGELVNADGSTGIQSDSILPPASVATDSAPALRVAVQVARGKVAPSARVFTAAMYRDMERSNAENVKAAWNNAHYPIMGARLLAAFKLWGTLRTFHAYGDLRDESLEDAMLRFIPRVEAASDAYGYSSVMLEFATTMSDAQATMTSPTIVQHLGGAAAPFTTRWIDSRALVTQVAADEAGRATGLTVGDEIVAADGYPMPAYVSEHRRYGAASNDWTRYRNTMTYIPRGLQGDALFRVRDAANKERTVTLQRSLSYLDRLPDNERSATPVFRELTSGIGYLDMHRATVAQTDSAFSALGTTRGLIIDARGAGGASTSALLPAAYTNVLQRVATMPSAVISKQAMRVASEPCALATLQPQSITCAIERRQFDDIIVADSAHHYRGRLVVLVDERTQGPMEQFAIGLESVNNPTFIGSTTAGAAGTVSAVTLPGQMTVTFSATEMRHADGRQLQRVGLSPEVEVRPTAKGVRAGTDEVLERAQQWLAQQLNPAPAKRGR